MTWIKKTFKTWSLFFVLITGLVLAGCEGSDSREKIDDTVKEFSGQKNLERMDQMKKDIVFAVMVKYGMLILIMY